MENRNIGFIDITPEFAESLLKMNANNRPVKRKRVETYARDMINGKWEINGEPIIIDSNGNLKDGQHRLMAVIESQCTCTMAVIMGVNPDCTIYDRGVNRSYKDIISMHYDENWKHANNTIAICNAFLKLNSATNQHHSDYDIIKFIDTYEEQLKITYDLYKGKKLCKKTCVECALFLQIHNGEDIEKLKRYLTVFESGIMQKSTDSPVIYIRNMALTKKLIGSDKKLISIIIKSIEDFESYQRKKPYLKANTFKVDSFIEDMKQKGF